MKTLVDLHVGRSERFQSHSCVAGKSEGERDGHPSLLRPVDHGDYPSPGVHSDQRHQLQK